MLLLAGATSLPEIATTFTAVWIGNVSMAVHNLLGSVVFNTAALAIADFTAGSWALTHRSPKYVLRMEGVGVVFLLALVQLADAVSRVTDQSDVTAIVWGIGLILAYASLLYITHYSQKVPRWRPAPADDTHHSTGTSQPPSSEEAPPAERENQRGYRDWSSPLLYCAFAAAGLIVLLGGAILTRAGDALATQTGLGGSFVGFTLLALSTTLPEISTTIAAARSANYSMTVSNIFGSSAFVIMLLGVIAIFIGGETLTQAASPSAMFAVVLGIVVTLVYLWGLLEREDRTLLRMGWDSAAVVVLVLVGSWVMFMLK